MDIGSIFLFLAIIVPVGLFISKPFFESSRKSIPEGMQQVDHTRSSLLAERDRILSALSELDFDNSLGKIPAEDYQFQRVQLLERGADVLRKLDEIDNSSGSEIEDPVEFNSGVPFTTTIPGGRPADSNSRKPLRSPDDELEALLAARRRQRQDKAAGFCHNCGGALRKSDKYCPKCGADILEE